MLAASTTVKIAMKTVAIFSGGLDSTVLVEQLRQAGDEVLALSIDYGQRHRKELQFAEQTAARLGIEWRLADLRAITPLHSRRGQGSPSRS